MNMDSIFEFGPLILIFPLNVIFLYLSVTFIGLLIAFFGAQETLDFPKITFLPMYVRVNLHVNIIFPTLIFFNI